MSKTDDEHAPDESSKPEYAEYIKIPEWKRRRDECLRLAEVYLRPVWTN